MSRAPDTHLPRVVAVVLAGGSGTRFWPMSRRRRPKQLQSLEGGRTLLQATVDRLRPLIEPRDVWVATTRELADEVARQLPEVPAEQVLIEPEARNTAPAIGWAVRSLPAEVRRGVIAVLPADHRMGDPEAFRAALGRAAEVAAERNTVVALGVVPRWAETGYGYLKLGRALDEGGLRRVSRFVEKPDEKAARRFYRRGGYLWNAGIFVFRGGVMLRQIKRHLPELSSGLEAMAAEPARRDEIYRTLPSISIDHGVMEKMRGLAALPLDCAWSDLGSWAALAEVLPKDPGGNASRGEVVAVEARDNLLIADHGTLAVLGVSGLAVVRSGDAVLVVPLERAQEVRRILAACEASGKTAVI